MLVHLALCASLSTVQAFERPPGGAGALHWLDVDRDGDVDLVAIDADGGLRFLRQESARSFVDVSATCGLEALRDVRALVAADIDGDALPDLVLGGAAGVQLLGQTKGGAFEVLPPPAGLEGLGEVLELARLDLDGDGGLDLLVTGADGRRLFRDLGDGSFEELELGLAGAGGAALAPAAGGEAPGELTDPASTVETPGRRSSAPAAVGAQATPGASAAIAASPDVADASGGAAFAGSPSAATLGLAGCIKSIADQALPGSCLEASSIPELGLLYPLSNELNVDAATGRVGINTTSPGSRLHVVGQGRFQGSSEASTSPGSGLLQVLSYDALSGLALDLNELQVWGAELSINPEGSFGTRVNESLFVQPGELVGIGKQPAPGFALDVDGVIRADDTIVSTKPAGAPFLIASQDLSANLNADLLDGLHASAFSQLGALIETAELADGAVTDQKVSAGIAGTKILPDFGAQDVVTTGRIGIGTSPTFDLEVAGTAKLDNLRIATGASSGLVLTSDAGGWASWQPAPSSLPDSDWIVNGADMYAGVAGKVGIGTSTPTAGLHLSSIDGFLATGTLNMGTIPAEGHGVRMMWYPRKGAFRAGSAGTEWDDAMVGPFSVALGYSTTASGLASVAIGSTTVASNVRSLAAGDQTTASGYASTSLGHRTRAESSFSTAVGRFNLGGGNPDFWVVTDPLFEIGNGLTEESRKNALTVLKNGNTGIGIPTPSFPLHVRGGTTEVSTDVVVRAEATATSGFGTALLATSAADEGRGLVASVTSVTGTPIAVAAEAPANGYAGYFGGRTYTTTLGVGVEVPAVPLQVDGGSDASPTSGGDLVVGAVSGQNIVVDGNEIMARNNGAAASLNLNAEGGDVVVGGSSAASSTLALRNSSGQAWEITKAGHDLSIAYDSPGTASIYLDGLSGVGVGRSSVSAALDVQAVAGGDLFSVRNISGTQQVVVESSGEVGIGTTNPSALLDVTGTVRCVQLVETSDARLKREVRELEGALASVLALRGVSFEWDRAQLEDAAEGRHLGFLAQEVRELLPEAVREGEDGRLSVSYSAIVPVLAEGVGELHERVLGLEQQLARGRSERELLASRLARIESALAGEPR